MSYLHWAWNTRRLVGAWSIETWRQHCFICEAHFSIILNIPKKTVQSLDLYSCPVQLTCCSAVRFRITTWIERQVCSLTLLLLTWKIWRASIDASRWQMGFNSEFKGLNILGGINFLIKIRMSLLCIYVFLMNVNIWRKWKYRSK
jgi:hypothetical protein